MPVKIFLLGLPGSGKSSAATYIKRKLRIAERKFKHYTDFEILLTMSTQKKYFYVLKQTTCEDSGVIYTCLEVLEPFVLDDALKQLTEDLKEYLPKAKPNEVILIEFARKDYNRDLDLFFSQFTQDAYFLYINAHPDDCIKRIKERAKEPKSLDDHYISAKSIEEYYPVEILPQGEAILRRLKRINNYGSLAEFEAQIDAYLKEISI